MKLAAHESRSRALSCFRHPAITGAIVGARNAKQVEGVMRTDELKLTTAEIAEIEGAALTAVSR